LRNLLYLDPTYLRTIVDGLLSGSFQKVHAMSLPQGLVGVYEEVYPTERNVIERKRFLELFGLWALLKKEVSTEFVCELLDGWNHERVLVI
jgi:hypothetical protein